MRSSLLLFLSLATAVLSSLVWDESSLRGTAGFFRVGQDVNGTSWFMTPTGDPFFFKGVTSVNRGGLAEGAIGPYFNSTLARYGNSSDLFKSAVTSRLIHWNFNSLGAWCTPEFWSDSDSSLPFTIDVELSKSAPTSTLLSPYSTMPDVFSRDWHAYAAARAVNVCSGVVDNSNLVGYFTDNELPWPHLNDSERSVQPTSTPLPFSEHGPSILQVALSTPPTAAAFNASWTWTLARYGGSLQALSEAWQLPTALKSLTDVAALYSNASLTLASAQYQVDDLNFMELYAAMYWNVSASVIAAVDGNHLIMGAKFGSVTSPAVYAGMRGSGHSVVSADNYRYNMSDRARDWATTGLPVLIAEYSWEGSGCPVPGSDELQCCEAGADPSVGGMPCPIPGGEPVNGNFSNLFRMYCNGAYAALDTFTVPDVVGWTWYRWVDEGDSPSQFQALGLVDLWDNVKPVAISYIAAINAAAEQTHATGVIPLPKLNSSGGSLPSWLQRCPIY